MVFKLIVKKFKLVRLLFALLLVQNLSANPSQRKEPVDENQQLMALFYGAGAGFMGALYPVKFLNHHIEHRNNRALKMLPVLLLIGATIGGAILGYVDSDITMEKMRKKRVAY